MEQFVIFGPSNSGKTSLLSTLQQAVFNRDESGWRVIPKSEGARRLFRAAGGAVLDGRAIANATYDMTKVAFEFEFTRKPSLFLPRQTVKAHYSLLDGPGGALFVDGTAGGQDDDVEQAEAFRAELLSHMRQSIGAMLCVDATDRSKARSFFLNLPDILCDLGMDKLPFRRFVICLTKADALFVDRRSQAHEAAQQSDAVQLARDILTRPGVNALLSFAPKTMEIAVAMTSAYGFDVERGNALIDARTGQIALRADGRTGDISQDIERWQPFRVVDPFIFLASGDLGSLQRWR